MLGMRNITLSLCLLLIGSFSTLSCASNQQVAKEQQVVTVYSAYNAALGVLESEKKAGKLSASELKIINATTPVIDAALKSYQAAVEGNNPVAQQDALDAAQKAENILLQFVGR